MHTEGVRCTSLCVHVRGSVYRHQQLEEGTCCPLVTLRANLAFTWAFLRRYQISCPPSNTLSLPGVELLQERRRDSG